MVFESIETPLLGRKREAQRGMMTITVRIIDAVVRMNQAIEAMDCVASH
jgi:hypothetical protein